MKFKFWLTCLLFMYFNYIQEILLCSENSETEDRRFKNAESKANGQYSQGFMIMKKGTIKGKDTRDQKSNDVMRLMTKLEILEETQNDLIQSVNGFIQTTKENQNKLIASLADINLQMTKSAVRYDTTEKELNELKDKFESMTSSSFAMQDQQTISSELQQNIRDVKRAASLLAISKIKLADLPYTMQCDKNGEMGDLKSHMDACIQTRLAELYDDFNDVMDFHVMLVGGSGPHEGRVEIIYQGRHGTVCDYYWDTKDAKVVCKMLGYEAVRNAYRGSHFGNGTGKILFDLVDCTGDEGSLLACKHRGIGGDRDVGFYCHHGRDAGVRCRT